MKEVRDRYLLRNRDTHHVHEAVQMGNVMMTKCNWWVRWDTPHPRWEGVQVTHYPPETAFTCRKCVKVGIHPLSRGGKEVRKS